MDFIKKVHLFLLYSMRFCRLPRLVLACVLLTAVTAPPATASPLTIGYLTGSGSADVLGQKVLSLLTAVQTDIPDLTVTSTTVLDGSFFGSIDAFVFINALGNDVVSLGSTARTNLQAFVAGGGMAYLGLDLLGDASLIVSDFGFSLINRQPISSTGTITVPGHPIAAGPFQPASEFSMSFHGNFNPGILPAAGSFLANSPLGPALAFTGNIAGGHAYLFADELGVGPGGQRAALFKNALCAIGASCSRPPSVPEPTTLFLMGIGLAGLGFARRRRLNA